MTAALTHDTPAKRHIHTISINNGLILELYVTLKPPI